MVANFKIVYVAEDIYEDPHIYNQWLYLVENIKNRIIG